MSNPVFNPQFWRSRLLRVQDQGLPVHVSVYDEALFVWERIQECSRKVLAQYVEQRTKVLDAGCGYGGLIECFPVGYNLKYYAGIDLSPDFIQEADARYPSLMFTVGDLRRMSGFSDGLFDLAVARSVHGMVVENMGQEQWDPMEKELLRVAKRLLLLSYEEPDLYVLKGRV